MISFADFFAAMEADPHRRPYPWQEALAERLAVGEPPQAIVVPTGGGKTVTIDALIWALAAQADRTPRERTVGVRTVWAIDRRILVDEVHQRATRIANRLEAALADNDDELNEVALRLHSLTGELGSPLIATRWRGGLAREQTAYHPAQPQIITSTVAQIGSRLLFRGYGVGERSLALEAGLAAVDTTICLDEAHLVEPFRQTVKAIRTMRADERLRLPGLRAITLTATPMADTDTTDLHTITKADRAALGTRLTGTKVASLAEPASDSHADQVATLLDAVDEQLEAGVQTIACVVNSVRTAIDVEAGISKRQPDVARALLIGPQRPADRKRLLEEHRGRLFEREVGEMPFICIATQTFEVGLDADVAGLVTQSASAVALVQRLGRLNRAGRDRGSAKIVRDTHSPLYEDDEPLAWEWLRSRELPDGTIDVSVAALLDDTTRPAPARSPTAADLTPEVVELLVQTAPRPDRMADPDVEVFLSGEERSADVSLCWRCDLRIDDDSQSGRTYRKALLRLAPPGREELVAVSIARAHMLLAALRAPRNQIAALSKVAIDEPDVDGGDQTDSPRDLLPAARDDGNAPQRLVLLRGRDQHEVALGGDTHAVDDLRLRDIRPGDVLVLPTSAGGYANGALAPGSRAAVEDVAADIRREDRDSPPLRAVRITEEALIASHLATHAPQGEPPSSELRRQAREEMRRLMSQARRIDAGHKSGLGEQRERLDAADQDPDLRRVTVDTDPFMSDLDDDADEILGLTSHGDDEDPDRHDHLLFADEQGIEAPAFVLVRPRARLQEVRSGDPPTLDEHARAVSNRARCYVKSSGLPTAVAASVVLAARAHDHGKADPRFQAFYRGGVPAYGQAALAKSVFGTADTQADRRARSAAGLPDGLRHEIGSVAALAGAITQGRVSDMPEEVDVELALHLVGTHHGLGRPIPRVPKFSARSAEPREFAAQAAGISATARGDAREGWDSGAWLRRFLITIERFGPWGTAYLEALLVLADRSVSGEGG